MRGCLIIFVIIVATIAFSLFLFAPVIIADSDIAKQSLALQASLFCGSGDTFEMNTFRASYHRPGETGVRFLCTDAQGDTNEVTGNFVLLMFGVFTVPFLLIFLLAWLGIMKTVKTATTLGGTTVRINGQPVGGNAIAPEVRAKLNQFGLGGILDQINTPIGMSASASSGDKSLTQQLKELEEAYNKHLISQEEYDILRQRILNSMG